MQRIYALNKSSYMKWFASICLLSSLAACSSSPKRVSFDASADPHEETEKLAQDIDAAVTQHYDILDNKDFAKAESELNKARREEKNGDKNSEVLKTLGEARGYLNRAQAMSTDLAPKAQGILDARTAALNAGVRTFPGEAVDLKKADDDFRSNVSDLKKGKLSARRWSELQAQYLNLELRAIQDTKLGDAQAKIEQALKDDARSNVPSTLKQAEFDLQNARNVIATDRHNYQDMQPAVEKANASAEFLKEVVAASRGGQVGEAVAVDLVMKTRKISSLNAQVSEKTSEADSKDQELASREREMKAQALEMSMNQAMRRARQRLSPKEAEIFRQGDKLLIRLKSVDFPIGKATLPKKSLPLMAKVKSITQSLNPEQVVVEGHTDSTGDPTTNLELSQKRAEAVATYFENNNGVAKDKVEAIGYGFKKPLTSNSTQSGRATNRRVDVLITPSQSLEANGPRDKAM